MGSANAADAERKGKNLRGTFPFNTGARGNARAAGNDHHHDHAHGDDHDHDHDHHDHDHHDHAAESVPARDARQRGRQQPDVQLDIGSIAAAGRRCIDKVVMVQETEYDDEITCNHSYSQKCHTTYSTDFKPQQEEECEENFIKKCFIDYKKMASEEEVEFCRTPLVCDGPGEPVCRTEYESQCSTHYHEHEVEDDIVDCVTEYEVKCIDVTQGYTTEKKCDKWPKQVCTKVTKPVKKYSPVTECTKVPVGLRSIWLPADPRPRGVLPQEGDGCR